MYVTRPLSLYRNSPLALEMAPPEGPNSGVLVFQDEDDQPPCCFGLMKNNSVTDLPFPQNAKMKLWYSSGAGENQRTEYLYALFIPVLNLPLSSNRYYLIKSRGKHKGKAYTSSREEDMKTCCFCRCISDVPPKLFDPNNSYQQYEIKEVTCCAGKSGFVANSVYPDAFPPCFLRRSGWRACTSTLRDFDSAEAPGLDSILRANLPELNSPLLSKAKPVVVGKWYCPFIFIREGEATVEAQMSKTPYYVMTLEQNWEEIFKCQNDGHNNDNNNNNGVVIVDTCVQRQVILVDGKEAERKINDADGFMWVSSLNGLSVGLSLAIVERVKWEQERVGFEWIEGKKNNLFKVQRNEEINKLSDKWKRFGCYVLVERFVLKRMDGSLVLTWDFKHTHQIRTKWE